MTEKQYKHLMEDNRIYRALKFKARKGFFNRLIPSSWIATILYYGGIAALILLAAAIVTPSKQPITAIVAVLSVIISPICLLIIGIVNRVRYIKEKANWKECTDGGDKDINDVYEDYKQAENTYFGLQIDQPE
jgi:hypothetical protein